MTKRELEQRKKIAQLSAEKDKKPKVKKRLYKEGKFPIKESKK